MTKEKYRKFHLVVRDIKFVVVMVVVMLMAAVMGGAWEGERERDLKPIHYLRK
jgi:hypothetical protein